LCIKSPERSHLPSQNWEKITLDANQSKAMDQVDLYLQFWDKRSIKRCKIRYQKIQTYLKRMRKIRMNPTPTVQIFKKRYEKRLDKREKRALGVAHIENKIQAELLERLRQGVYGDLYKFKPKEGSKEEQEEEEELDEEELPYVPDYSDFDVVSEGEDLEDIYNEYEDMDEEQVRIQNDKPKKRRHLEIEYEK
jgi:protein MAK16